MVIPDSQADSFWFVDDKSKTFDGIINTDYLDIKTTTLDDSYFLDQARRNNKTLIIQGNLRNGKKITAIASFLGSKEDADNCRFRFSLKYVFYDVHFDSSDIRFKAIMVNFLNINRWITPYAITYAKEGSIEHEITIDIDDVYLLKFFHRRPVRDEDKKTTDKHQENVYVIIESKKDEKNFVELLELMNVIQDFLNFVITENSVLPNSTYGVTQKNGEENLTLIEAKLKSRDGRMNKSKVKRPVLFHSSEHMDILEKIFKKWFEFKNSHNTIYRYYMDSIYGPTDAIELSYFKLAAFLEGYHRESFEKNGRSRMRKLKDKYFQSIETMLKEIDVDEGYIKTVNFMLRKHKDLSLAQRLREIFEDYIELISVTGPVLSFFDKKRLCDWIREKVVDKNIREKLVKVIDLKIEADSKIIDQERKQKCNTIVDFLKSEDVSIRSEMLLFVKFVLTEKFAKEFATFRNVIGHVLDRKYQDIPQNKWIYAFKILQLTGQLCILSLLEFTPHEISNMFFLDRQNDIEKLRTIIETNIGV